jgi:hypothetical protein
MKIGYYRGGSEKKNAPRRKGLVSGDAAAVPGLTGLMLVLTNKD